MNLKKHALLITLLLLISGFSASFLLLNATASNNLLVSNEVSIKTSAYSYDWIDIWSESQTNADDADDIAINSTGSIIVGGTTQAQHQYLAIYDNNSNSFPKIPLTFLDAR